MNLDLLAELSIPADTKMVLLVIDGLGGLPRPADGLTELEAAHTPHLDELARQSLCGLIYPVAPGITPGSGPGHLALFGYDPLRYQIGRGVLEALGIGFDLQRGDVAARGNFCTVDEEGRIVDRRAGRIPTEQVARLCQELRKIKLEGTQIFVEPVKDYRFVLVLRGSGLSAKLSETDPQQTGVPPLPVRALAPEAQYTAQLVNRWVAEARRILAHEHPANMVILRGFASEPSFPKLREICKLKTAAIAVYPMYRGLARLVGMEVLPSGDSLEEEFACLKAHFDAYDFFYLHVKWTDSAGEDGDFDRKVALIEEVDRFIPQMMALKPDVVVVTSDHSTPSALKAHSWHPVPTLLYSHHCRPDGIQAFGESACGHGSLTGLRGVDLMPLMLAHALRLAKYGA